jgi:RNA polymerase sigma-70 factor (ECF subfamily)
VEGQFHRLLATNGPALLRLAASYTSTASDRDDLFQEICLAIWKALPGFRGESSDRTSIFRIAHNRAISHLARRPRLPFATGEIEVLDPNPDPETDLLRRERGDSLTRAIRQLPLDYRQVMTLALEGLTYGEIAQVVGIGESNVGVRLNRGRAMLRRLMETRHDA